MDTTTEQLYEAIADNDLMKSKKFLKIVLDANNKKCDAYVKNRILKKINTPSLNLIEVPFNIKGFLQVENVELTFNEKRYVTTPKDEEMINQIINTFKVNDKLIEYGINYLNSILLYGVPGCGKTMLGRYIAYKLNMPFAYLNFSNLITSLLGKTGENIQKVFDYISTMKCVFMLDEVDAIGLERGKDSTGELSRVVINLMQALDKFENDSIIIGATNRADTIDKALLRRFSLKYEMQLPNEEVQYKLVESFLNTLPNSKYTDAEILSFLSGIQEKTCANITNALTNRVVNCIIENKEITLY
ncbi:AAA family ATPase [Clostridium beijerinckii]|uniref:AAA family ATPase n=2 Tax=Bacteria TaxID=2 RepID=UPI00136140F7|nr:ATP-binding protein [Clostridium beijerinckii]MZK53352.1 AAA family ATPase [Clostridium beijerinckii]MZK61457.1 AAA family ATPase [Clostridium beijerinckii]MZK71699.1 AAA family ATPase [Clostridium beijerinckii]MZK77092.1 AAA family ATPase [Clostridium beijerinckii]MZK86747.1 AAA family ATPase [Clostridium beijerinckii]